VCLHSPEALVVVSLPQVLSAVSLRAVALVELSPETTAATCEQKTGAHLSLSHTPSVAALDRFC
jgi:hypothetical protein